MTDKYILKDRVAVRCPDLMEWARWFEAADRHVAVDYVGSVRISTVFLGIDHSYRHVFGDDAPPVLFETMIFGGPHDQHQERCSTWEEAERQHAEALALARASLN